MKRHRRQTGHHSQHQAAQHEKNRVWNTNLLRDGRQRQDQRQQQDDDFEFVQAFHLSAKLFFEAIERTHQLRQRGQPVYIPIVSRR